jgi:hypothetical protein
MPQTIVNHGDTSTIPFVFRFHPLCTPSFQASGYAGSAGSPTFTYRPCTALLTRRRFSKSCLSIDRAQRLPHVFERMNLAVGATPPNRCWLAMESSRPGFWRITVLATRLKLKKN